MLENMALIMKFGVDTTESGFYKIWVISYTTCIPLSPWANNSHDDVLGWGNVLELPADHNGRPSLPLRRSAEEFTQSRHAALSLAKS